MRFEIATSYRGKAALAVMWAVCMGLAAGCRGGGDGGGDGGTDTDGGTGTGGSETDDGTDGGVPVPDEGVPAIGLRRLTRHEYDNTLRDLLGDDSRPSAALPEDQLTPFDNDYSTQLPSQLLVESAEILSRDVAQALVADTARRDTVVGCTPQGPVDSTCTRAFISHFGRLALRRPLDDAEVDELETLAEEFAMDGQDFYAGVETVVRALLQDGEFLYRVERGTLVEGEDDVYRLGPYERATRLAYLVWGSTPDDALLDLAGDGGLDTSDDIRAAAEQMLDDPRAHAQIDRFHALWLGYEQLPHSPALVGAMRTETAALVSRVIFDDQAPWPDLFTSPVSYVNDDLADLYGVPRPGDWTWVDVSGVGRAGLLSQGSFLSVAANPGDTSPTKRGILIRERLLCQVIPAPPPEVDVDNPPQGQAGDCKWDRYASHRTDAACSGCHEQIDPIGFGLENYDREGRYRDHDDGAPQCTIEGSGDVVGLGVFNGPAELGELLVGDAGFSDCAAQHLLQYTIGRSIAEHDLPLLTSLSEEFEAEEFRFHELVLHLVSHDSFGFRRED